MRLNGLRGLSEMDRRLKWIVRRWKRKVNKATQRFNCFRSNYLRMEKSRWSYRGRTSEKNLLTVLHGEGAAQPTVVAPGRIGADETGLEDFNLVRLHAQHNDLVQSAWLESFLEFDADTSCSSSSIRPRRAPV